MRIAIVTDYHNKTGIGKQNYQLYRALLELGHDATIVSLVSSQGFKEKPDYGLKVESPNFLRGVFRDFRIGLEKTVREGGYDVVLLGHQGLAYLRRTVEYAGAPAVLVAFDFFTLYPQYASRWNPKYFVFNRLLLAEAGKFENVVFSSKFTERDFERFFRSRPRNSTVIPVGIPESSASSYVSARDWGAHFNGKRVILQVGSADKRKNSGAFFDVAKAAEKSGEYGGVVFVRVGKTSDEQKAGAPSNMAFLQNLSEDDLFSLYAYASAFVFTSLHEGYGMPVAEARAVGLPVVSTKISDMAELFADDPGVAFVDDANDPEEYLNGISAFLQLPHTKIDSPSASNLTTRHEAEAYVSFFRQTVRNSSLK